MIYAGQEFGEDTKKVVGFNPLDWSHMEQPAYRQLWENTKRLIGLRRSHPALTGEDVEWLLLDAGRDVFAYRRDAGDDAVITAGNLSGEAHDIKLSAAAGSSWRNLLEDTTVIANADGATLRLEAGEAVVLIRRQAGE
jgi:1,4-alpha-glucan branching enzyme